MKIEAFEFGNVATSEFCIFPSGGRRGLTPVGITLYRLSTINLAHRLYVGAEMASHQCGIYSGLYEGIIHA